LPTGQRAVRSDADHLAPEPNRGRAPRVAVEATVFGLAGAGLAVTGQGLWTGVFIAVALVNGVLVYAWDD